MNSSNGPAAFDSTSIEARIDSDAGDNDKADAETSTQKHNEFTNVDKVDTSTIVQSNPFIKSKFQISDNSFKFNFSIECD